MDPVLLKIVGMNFCLFVVVYIIDVVMLNDEIEYAMGIMYDFWRSTTVSSIIAMTGYIVFFFIA